MGKSVLGVVAALLLALPLIACAEGESPPTPTPSPQPAAAPTPTPAAEAPDTTVASEPSEAGGAVVTIGPASVARYLVKEQLAGRNLPNDAVGVTGEVEGQIAFTQDGRVDAPRSRITIGVHALTSDSDRRDGYVRDRTLDTSTHADVVLDISSAPGLPWPLPADGEADFQLLGRLTIRNQSNPATWDVTAQFSDGAVVGMATTLVTFEQYALTKPRVAVVISVADEIRLEIDFTATVSGE